MLVERGKYHNGLINSKTVTLEIKRLVTNTLSYNTRGAEIGHCNKIKTVVQNTFQLAAYDLTQKQY